MGKVLVTGADGFIGSHLVEALVHEGRDVKAMVRYTSRDDFQNLCFLEPDILDHVEICKGDVIDPYSVSNAVYGCSAVMHLAALIGIPYSYVAPASYVNVNVTGTLNILEACREHEIERLIHTSTSETYGSAQYTPMDEQHPAVGQSPYAASKIAADQLVGSYWRSFRTPATIIRPFNTYGPRQSSRAIIPTIISQLLASGSLTLGSLSPVRDLTFVRDTAAGFVAALKSELVIGDVVNLGVGSGLSIRELANLICELIGSEVKISQSAERMRPKDSEVSCLISDNSRAKELMQWLPQTSLESGLAETVDFVRSHPDRFRVGTYGV